MEIAAKNGGKERSNNMIIDNMKQIPIIGFYNEEIQRVSEQIANSYNESLNSLNKRNFLGFDFNLNETLKGKKASLNIEDRVLEIYYNDHTTLIIPSLYITENTAKKYFDVGQQKLFENKLEEINILKGKGGGLKSFKKGMKSARKFFTKNVEIKNISGIESLSESIVASLRKVLGGDVVKKDEFLNFVKEFIQNPHAGGSIDTLYEKMFNSAIQTKNLDRVLSVIENKINESRNYKGFLKGKGAFNKFEKDIAKAYGVDIKDLSRRNQSEGFPALKRFASTVVHIFKAMIASFKAAAYGGLGYTIAENGLNKTIVMFIEFVFWKLVSLIGWTLGIDTNNKQIDKTSGGMLDSFENFKEGLKEFTNTTMSGVASAFESLVNHIFTILKDSLGYLDSTPILKYLRYPSVALVIYLCVRNIIKFTSHIRQIKNMNTVSVTELAGQLSKEELTNNFGFDKVLASEMIMIVITEHIDHVLLHKKSKFSPDELKRLEMFRAQINRTGKKYCKEGIKLSTNYTRNIIKEFISIFR